MVFTILDTLEQLGKIDMNNLNFCKCADNKSYRRNYHGVVCTRCNPSRIEPLLVPNSVTAYRIWKFNHQKAFKQSHYQKLKWSQFNDLWLEGFPEETDIMKPWSGSAYCAHSNHKAPNPYCSCGFYSINTFGNESSGAFGHDATDVIVSDFDIVLPILERYDEQTQKSLLELLFYSPVAKTIEIQEFRLLSEVELTGTIIECEIGYRSEYVIPKKMFLLLNIDKLYQITSYIGKKLNKDNAEILHVTYQWLLYIDNYLTNMMKLYGLDFELRFKYIPEHLADYEMLTGDQTKGSEYLPLRDHPLVYTKLRNISEIMKESSKFLQFKFPSLEIMLEKTGEDRIRNAYINWDRTGQTISPVKKYVDYLLSFSHFNCMLSEQKNDKLNLLSYPNLTEHFGFRYHTYLENKYSANELLDKHSISKEHPSRWFKYTYPYFEQYLEQIGRNSTPKYQQINFNER